MSAPTNARGLGQELWFLCPGSEERLRQCTASFAEALPERVLAHADPGCRPWAEAFARAALRTPERLGPETPEELAALLPELARPHARVLFVLPAPLLTASVALALGLAERGRRALRVDPGRAFLLRDERMGLVLRHANVLGPEREPGTRLPLWKSAP